MSERQRLPNLVMPGVAKCGTTTLCDILVSHPAIAGGFQKEVRYLMDAHDDNYSPDNIRTAGRDGWIKRYPDGGNGNFRYWLDASPQYQYQRTAFETIAAMPEAPQLIFIVRRPSRRLFSMYQFARYHMGRLPHVTSFAQFLAEIRQPEASPIASQRMLANALADCRYDEMLECHRPGRTRLDDVGRSAGRAPWWGAY